MNRSLLLFALLTVVATWPQAIRLDSIPNNVDAYFSLWRLGWIAHQLPDAPRHLFDGNIFHPEPNTLAYSDAVLLQGVIALPFIRSGAPIVYVYNLLVLGSFVAGALGMFVLARYLTRAALPAFLAGLAFAFAPYRFDHYHHLELLWAGWMPLAFWMAHRTLESGRLRDGLGTGALVALQTFSCIYYGIFLCTALAAFAILLLGERPIAARRRAMVALAAGGATAAVAVLPYMIPYWRARDAIGDRNTSESALYAAGPRHYLAAMPENRLAGPLRGGLGRHEKRLFPGFVVLALTIVALWPPTTRTAVTYGVVLAVAINLSVGPRGIGYEWLREYVVVYRGLRAPARFGRVALLAFAVLAALGGQRLGMWLATRGHRANASIGVLIVAAFAEYLVEPLALTAVPTKPPPAYAWLRTQPEGVLAEFPTPTRLTMPLHEGEFQFFSTFHWRPLVNGYSGNWSHRHMSLLDRLSGFPDGDSLEALRSAVVTYVLVHQRYYGEHGTPACWTASAPAKASNRWADSKTARTRQLCTG